jgi:excisionase family DNA binding protein
MTVYFVEAGENGPIKIGHTDASVASRISWLQTGSPVPLRLLASMPGDRDVEAKLHGKFVNTRIRGEWFERTETLMRIIRRYAIATKKPVPRKNGNTIKLLPAPADKIKVRKSRKKRVAEQLERTQPLSIKDVADRLGRTKRTIFRWLEDGRFPNAYKIPGRQGGEWRIPPDDLLTLEIGPPKRRCADILADGQPCQAPALKGSDYCRWHQGGDGAHN